MKMDFFDLLDISKLERRIFGHGAISPSFGLVWLQGDLVLPAWSTCETTVVLQATQADIEQTETQNRLEIEKARVQRELELSASAEKEDTRTFAEIVDSCDY